MISRIYLRNYKGWGYTSRQILWWARPFFQSIILWSGMLHFLLVPFLNRYSYCRILIVLNLYIHSIMIASMWYMVVCSIHNLFFKYKARHFFNQIFRFFLQKLQIFFKNDTRQLANHLFHPYIIVIIQFPILLKLFNLLLQFHNFW